MVFGVEERVMSKDFRFIMLVPLLGLTLGWGLPAVTARAGEKPAPKDPAAILAVVSGDVSVKRGKELLDGSFGASLEPGDVVETGDGAQAAVLFESGQIIELGPGSRITIGSVPTMGSESPVLAQVPDALSGTLGRFARSSSGAEGLAVLPDLRAGGTSGQPDPLSPRNTRVSPDAGRFEWTPVEDALEYRVHLVGPGGETQSHPATGTTWQAPQGLLKAGQRWTWSVEAVTPDGSVRSDEAAFELATADQWTEIAALKSRLEPLMVSEDGTRHDTGAYLFGSYCRSAGFYDEAIRQLEDLVRRHPDRKELHQELGSLYQAVDRNDKAAQEYRLALKE
jgi:hypothetical protein